MRNYLPSDSLIAYKANIFVDLICCKGFVAYNGYVKCKFVSETKGMFGNCFFPIFSVFKNNFLFLKLKNLFGN